MNRRTWVLGVVCMLSAGFSAATALGQEPRPGQEPAKPAVPKKAEEPKKPEVGKPVEKPEAGKPSPEMEEMMKKIMELGAPGESHKRLEPLVGKWELDIRTWMSPDAPPDVSKGKCEWKWILGGRQLQQDITGPGPTPNAPPFHGLGLLGYDNMKKQYHYFWFDDMWTGVMIGYGTADASGKVITVSGEGPDPLTGQLNKKWRGVIKIENNDKNTYEMYSTGPDGKESKDMEIVFTRVK